MAIITGPADSRTAAGGGRTIFGYAHRVRSLRHCHSAVWMTTHRKLLWLTIILCAAGLAVFVTPVFHKRSIRTRIKPHIRLNEPFQRASIVSDSIWPLDSPGMVLDVLWEMAISKKSTNAKQNTAVVASRLSCRWSLRRSDPGSHGNALGGSQLGFESEIRHAGGSLLYDWPGHWSI